MALRASFTLVAALYNLPMTKSTGMSKTKYDSETTITQAKCTKKWDKICELCQGRLPQTKYIPRLLNFYF